MTAKELKASILDLAIRGKLVPQDPNDEPAKNLLARIAAEKAKLVKSGKLKKGKPLPPITDDDKPFGLPRGWTWCRLGGLASKLTDGEHKTPRRVVEYCGYYLLSARNIHDDCLVLDDVDYVDKAEYELISQRCNPKRGDVLISCSGSIGRTCCVEDDNCYVMVRSAAMCRPIEVCSRYLMYALQSEFVQAQHRERIKKSAQANLFLGAISVTVIPLPPIAEQKRIVEKIEQVMPLVERYGQAEEKRRQLITALPEALKKSILKSAFDTGFNADCVFEEKTLEDVCTDVFTGNSLSDAEKRMFTTDKGLPFIGTKDVGFDQVVDYDNGIRIPASENKYRTAAAGSTLLCVEGGSSGRKIAILDQDVRFGNKLCAFVPSKKVDAHYLFLFLQSPQFLEQFAALQNGPRKGAGVSQVKKLMICYVPLVEQKRIVKGVDEVLAVIKRMC